MLGLWVRKGRDAKSAIRKESVGKYTKIDRLLNDNYGVA
jgi:hypothetical protein